jgi:hypothetical protein
MKIHRLFRRATAAAVLASCFGVRLLNGQPSPVPPNPRLAVRSGLVEVQRGSLWLPLTLGDSLKAGERVRTASGSSAVIEVGPDQLVTLNEVSMVRIGQVAQANGAGAPVVELESGSMKVFSSFDIRVTAKDTVLEGAGQPLDLELGYQAGKLNLTVFNGAVQNGPITIRGGTQDPSVRTYTAGAGGRPWPRREDAVIANPVFYVYPYFMYGQPDPNAGRIVPPVVNNRTNPGYRPTQVVPPMSDPLRVPVTKP